MLQLCIPVREVSQVGEARRAAARLCAEAQFDELRRGRIAIVVTELATNLVAHAGGGEVLLQLFEHAGRIEFEVLAIDRGPGMQLQQCMVDGHSTRGTPGCGLGAIQRQSDTFDAWSKQGAGTVVFSRIAKTGAPRASAYDFGALAQPYPGEIVCGDGWKLRETESSLLVQLVDGLGHGQPAADAAHAAAIAFDSAPRTQPAAVLEHAHARLSGTRGAAIAVALIDGSSRLCYAGIGNIAGSLLDDGGSRGLASHNGTGGVQLRKLQEFEYPWREDSTLVMHSDGLQTRWRLDNYPGLRQCHPAVIAGVLYRDFRRGRDDVSVLVASRARH